MITVSFVLAFSALLIASFHNCSQLTFARHASSLFWALSPSVLVLKLSHRQLATIWCLLFATSTRALRIQEQGRWSLCVLRELTFYSTLPIWWISPFPFHSSLCLQHPQEWDLHLLLRSPPSPSSNLNLCSLFLGWPGNLLSNPEHSEWKRELLVIMLQQQMYPGHVWTAPCSTQMGLPHFFSRLGTPWNQYLTLLHWMKNLTLARS